MNLIKRSLIIVALALLSASPVAAVTEDGLFPDIYFVSSKYELETAVRQKDALKGLAISINFYRNTAVENQEETEGLVLYVAARKMRPIFVYGQPFDNALAAKLLIDNDGSNCTPTAYAGIFPKDGRPGTMCGAADQPFDEAWIRNWISSNWAQDKKLYLNNRNE